MTDDLVERSSTQIEVKQFPEVNGVEAMKAGRLLALQEPSLGQAYFLDVTDSDDSTTEEPGHPEYPAEKVRDLIQRELNERTEGWNTQNSVVVLVTDKYDKEPRVYVGVAKTDPHDEEAKEITTHVAGKAGFKRISSYVPMSFDGGDAAREMLTEELHKAVDELRKSGREDLIKALPL